LILGVKCTIKVNIDDKQTWSQIYFTNIVKAESNHENLFLKITEAHPNILQIYKKTNPSVRRIGEAKV
jgi:hypothetical protein